MRALIIACILAFSSPSWALVAEAVSGTMPAALLSPVAGESPAILEAAAISVPEAGVIITPVPMPPSVIEVLRPIERSPKLRAARKASPAKKQAFPNILLTRTERHQLALLAAHTESGSQFLRKLLNDENGESGYDDLPLHRYYSRPRLASEEENEADLPDADDLSDTIKLRLLLARTKAVEAHALAHVADPGDDLSDAVLERLAQARQRAVEAHRANFC